MFNNNDDHDELGKDIENRTKIRRFLQEGRSRKQAFHDICSETKLEMLSDEQFELVFRCTKDADFFNLVPEELGNYKELALIVTDECVRLKNAIAEYPTARGCLEFCFLDSRYAICLAIERSRPKLFLLDLYHGQMRKFQVRDNALQFCKHIDYNFELVDSRFLLVLEHNGVDNFDVHCLLLDYNEMDCSLIGSAQIQHEFYDFIPDYKQSTKFAFISNTEGSDIFYLHLGSIVRSSQFNIETIPIRVIGELYYTRLDDNHLYAFKRYDEFNNTDNNSSINYEFGKYTLVPGQDLQNFNNICDIKTELINDDFTSMFDHWFNDCGGYIIGYDNKTHQGAVIIVDLKQRTASKISLNLCLKHECLSYYMDDYEGILTLCINDPLDEKPVVYRFALRGPDMLLDQVIFNYRRKGMFFGDCKYGELLPKLPNPLQPFGRSPAKTMGIIQSLNELQLDARSMLVETIRYVWNVVVDFVELLNLFEAFTLTIILTAWFTSFWRIIYLEFFV